MEKKCVGIGGDDNELRNPFKTLAYILLNISSITPYLTFSTVTCACISGNEVLWKAVNKEADNDD